MEVLDSNGVCLTKIDRSVSGPRHVIHVENISSLPRGAKAKASLPNGMRRLEFTTTTGPSADWEDETLRISAFGIADLECPIARNNGPAARSEPLQCDELHDKLGVAAAWQQLTAGSIPFQVRIDVG
jgi:hypothetical protein